MDTSLVNVDEFFNKGSIGRHETFTPRYGWLKKGFDALDKDPEVFKASDGIERLGVGKNMVSSIRFWCQAFKLIEPRAEGGMQPTKLGPKLMHDDGWDPYLEDIGSLWLLHWQMFIPKLEAVNWSLAFNRCNLWSFDIKQLSKVLIAAVQRYPRLAALSDNTYERDASCIMRMYTEDRGEKNSEIDCPFTQLGILLPTEDVGLIRFDNTEKLSLPPLIFAAACFSYIQHYVQSGQKTFNLQRLTFDVNSPGIAFKVPESAVGNYLNKAVESLDGFALQDTMGSIQVRLENDAEELYWQALEKYYKGI